MKYFSEFEPVLNKHKHFFCVLILLLGAIHSRAQEDSIYKNTIRFNITNPIIFGSRSIMLGYERQLKNNQSFSVNIGRASFPIGSTITIDSVEMERDFTESGFHLSGDYRFYLQRENKFTPPRGLYLGPYYSYNYYTRQNTWDMRSTTYQGELKSDFSMNIHTAGIEMGYQFVFWKRLSVDMILVGPGIAFYKLRTTVNTSLSEADQQLLFDAMNEYLSSNFPGYNYVFTGDGFKKTGYEKSTAFGYRYMVLVGFRF